MDFDLNLAREHSEKNPVYYVQYAHARICSLLTKAGDVKSNNIELTNAAEEDLAKTLFKFPELVEEVSKVNHSRASLAKAAQIVLKNTLGLMGINAPDKM